MTFGAALDALKQGKRVARAGWNGRSQSVHAVFDWNAAQACPQMFLRTAQGTVAPWVPSITDLWADDWHILRSSLWDAPQAEEAPADATDAAPAEDAAAADHEEDPTSAEGRLALRWLDENTFIRTGFRSWLNSRRSTLAADRRDRGCRPAGAAFVASIAEVAAAEDAAAQQDDPHVCRYCRKNAAQGPWPGGACAACRDRLGILMDGPSLPFRPETFLSDPPLPDTFDPSA